MTAVGLERPFKLLVVDDEEEVMPIFRQRMRREVRGGVYELFFARSGVEALEILDSHPDVDLVITDINMPEMDGLTLLERLRASDADLRAVVLSAYGDMANIRAAMNLGAFDFVLKPVDFDDLRVTINRTRENLREWRAAMEFRDQLTSLRQEIGIAGRIQQSVLPVSFPVIEGYGNPRSGQAGQHRGWRLLRRHAVGGWPRWPAGRGRMRQGHPGCHGHDVLPDSHPGRRHRASGPRPGALGGQLAHV